MTRQYSVRGTKITSTFFFVGVEESLRGAADFPPLWPYHVDGEQGVACTAPWPDLTRNASFAIVEPSLRAERGEVLFAN